MKKQKDKKTKKQKDKKAKRQKGKKAKIQKSKKAKTEKLNGQKLAIYNNLIDLVTKLQFFYYTFKILQKC